MGRAGIRLATKRMISRIHRMTKRLLRLAWVVVSLPLTGMAGENTSPATPAKLPADNPPLEANYVVALTSADKKGPELSMLVASQVFGASNREITFNAQLFPHEKGGFLLYYSLVQGSTETKATVLLHPGEVVQLVKNGDQFYNLRFDRYAPAGAQ